MSFSLCCSKTYPLHIAHNNREDWNFKNVQSLFRRKCAFAIHNSNIPGNDWDGDNAVQGYPIPEPIPEPAPLVDPRIEMDQLRVQLDTLRIQLR